MSKDLDGDAYARSLTGNAYPATEAVPDNPRLFRRRWVLRVTATLPESAFLAARIGQHVAAVVDLVRVHLTDSTARAELPSATAVRLDDHHVVLEIDCPTASATTGDIAAITTWGLLRAVDETWEIEDVQGIPRRYWFPMRR